MPTPVLTASATGAQPFVPGVLLQEENERCLVQSAGGSPQWLPRDAVFFRSPTAAGTGTDHAPSCRPRAHRPPAPHALRPARPPSCIGGSGVADNAQLFYLDEANLLDNLSVRYSADAIYTYTGTVLLAVNPYKVLDGLYSEERMDSYRGRALGVLPPHVYAIAERARRAIATDKTEQSIVVSGESGAGKTESCRAIVEYLAHHSRHEAGDLASALLAANPVLEAFGCAETTRNKNSSRCARLSTLTAASHRRLP